MFIGGRFLTGLGCTTAATSAKSYLAEITSPVNRGRWVALLNSFYYSEHRPFVIFALLPFINSSYTRPAWLGFLGFPRSRADVAVGQILASGIAIPFGYNPTDWAWRAPLMLQIIPAVCNVAFVLFLPESPRWCVLALTCYTHCLSFVR